MGIEIAALGSMLFAGGEAVSAAVALTAVAEIGLATTVVGAVTGNSTLMKIGGAMSLVGGVGGMIAGAVGDAAGAAGLADGASSDAAATAMDMNPSGISGSVGGGAEAATAMDMNASGISGQAGINAATASDMNPSGISGSMGNPATDMSTDAMTSAVTPPTPPTPPASSTPQTTDTSGATSQTTVAPSANQNSAYNSNPATSTTDPAANNPYSSSSASNPSSPMGQQNFGQTPTDASGNQLGSGMYNSPVTGTATTATQKGSDFFGGLNKLFTGNNSLGKSMMDLGGHVLQGVQQSQIADRQYKMAQGQIDYQHEQNANSGKWALPAAAKSAPTGIIAGARTAG